MTEVAVVTGGGQGIGLAISRALARENHLAVAILDSSDNGAAAADELRSNGAEALYVRADVSVESDVRRAVGEAKRLGQVRYLVNNAGIFPRSAALETEFSDWMRVVTVNLGGTFLVSKEFAPLIFEAGGGAIVNLASGRAAAGAVRGTHYSASKGGIISLTRSLALEWAPDIRVNAVMPGLTDTAQPRGEGLPEEELYARGAKVPLGRIGEPEDVADVVAFLLSKSARYMTGQTVCVNGGAIMR